MRRVYLLAILALTGFLAFSGCKNDQKDKPSDALEQPRDTAEELVKVYYLVPSPDDIFGFSEDKSLYFDASLLNPVENVAKYNDTKSQEFNFGVYSADLAYAAAFGQKQQTKDYLNAVKEISDKISLSGVFNDKLVERIDNLSTNKDSLIAISNDTYFDIIKYLEKTDRMSTLALMAAGGWLETIYIVANLADYDKNKSTIDKIAEQKLIFDNLYKLLEQNLSDPNVKSIYDEFKPLKNIFDQLQIVNEAEDDLPKLKDNKIEVDAKIKILMTKKQFLEFRDVINTIRNDLTLN